jgi:putative ABC transport system substrate-binding protein
MFAENTLFIADRRHIAELALKHRLPMMVPANEYAQARALISYGTDYLDLFRSAATYVDKILKGAKLADLPIEQPTKFELVINLKTAKALGLTIPQSVLGRADELIE